MAAMVWAVTGECCAGAASAVSVAAGAAGVAGRNVDPVAEPGPYNSCGNLQHQTTC